VNPAKTSASHPVDLSPPLAQALERNRAFWLRTPLSQPLLRVTEWLGWQPYPPFIKRGGAPLEDGSEIKPGLLDPKANVEANRPSVLLDGDFVNGWGPYDNCWSEAVLGCRIRRSGPSVWTEPFIHHWDDVNKVACEGSRAWIDELLEVNRVLAKESRGEYPVCQPLLRGPLDMAEAAIPTEMLFAGFYDEPVRLRRFLDLCTDIFVNIAKQRLSETPPFHGGYAVRQEFGLWAPGTTVQFQADAMRDVSAQLYREFLFEIDQRIAGEFEYPIIHTHSGSVHILPVIVDEAPVKAVEISIDQEPYGPPAIDLLPAFERVQTAGKSLLINGPMRRSELDTILNTLAPVGLAMRIGLLPD
jgi:hypothetical protein